jgi:hypothetical protein
MTDDLCNIFVGNPGKSPRNRAKKPLGRLPPVDMKIVQKFRQYVHLPNLGI